MNRNKEIVKTLYEQLEKGNINTNNILDYFEQEETIDYLSGIMADDFGISDINKCVEDLISIYSREKLVYERNAIIKQLENTENLNSEEISSLEKRLNEVILGLAKIK